MSSFHPLPTHDRRRTAIEFRLLGRVPLDDCLQLQYHLMREVERRLDGPMVVLLCEHAGVISVGRHGSRAHIRLSNRELRREQLALRWMNRGGGCVLHAPGQLAVYPIVPLERLGWGANDYLRRLRHGIADTLARLSVRGVRHPRRLGIWGRSGQLVCMGIAVRDGVSCHGAFVNVNPAMRLYGFVDTMARERAPDAVKTTMGCLVAERQAVVRMASVRAMLVKSLSAAFGCPRYHLHTGHPWLVRREPDDALLRGPG